MTLHYNSCQAIVGIHACRQGFNIYSIMLCVYYEAVREVHNVVKSNRICDADKSNNAILMSPVANGGRLYGSTSRPSLNFKALSSSSADAIGLLQLHCMNFRRMRE